MLLFQSLLLEKSNAPNFGRTQGTKWDVTVKRKRDSLERIFILEMRFDSESYRYNRHRVRRWLLRESPGTVLRCEKEKPYPSERFCRQSWKDLQSQMRNTCREHWYIFPCTLRHLWHLDAPSPLSWGSFPWLVWSRTICWVLWCSFTEEKQKTKRVNH
jgi:hypothetical protein